MKKLIIVIALCLATMAWADQKESNYVPIKNIPDDAKTIISITPIYSQKLSHMLPIGWIPVFDKVQGERYIIEYVPKGQSINNWTEMITVIGFKGAAKIAKPIDAILSTSNNIKKVCPSNHIYSSIGTTKVDGYSGYEAIVGCAEMPNSHRAGISKGQGEIAYYLAIAGDQEIYFIQKAIRSEAFLKSRPPLTPENYKEFISSIFPISLCKKSGAPYECPK